MQSLDDKLWRWRQLIGPKTLDCVVRARTMATEHLNALPRHILSGASGDDNDSAAHNDDLVQTATAINICSFVDSLLGGIKAYHRSCVASHMDDYLHSAATKLEEACHQYAATKLAVSKLGLEGVDAITVSHVHHIASKTKYVWLMWCSFITVANCLSLFAGGGWLTLRMRRMSWKTRKKMTKQHW